MNNRKIRALLVAAGLVVLSPSVFAAEAFDNCTGFIDTVPTTVSSQGTWCLRQDLSTNMTSGSAVTVAASNVTIDCNGYKIGGLAGGPATQAIGIQALNRANTVIRNCNIRGFMYGAQVSDRASLVEDNRFEGNTTIGLLIMGSGGVARRNQVFDTGGAPSATYTIGIRGYWDVDLIDNTIDTVAPRAGGNGFGFGILVGESSGGSIVGNRVRNVLFDGTGAAVGISNVMGSRYTISDNQVIGLDNGLGIVCEDSVQPTTLRNTVVGFQTARVGCNDDGGNLIPN